MFFFVVIDGDGDDDVVSFKDGVAPKIDNIKVINQW